MEIITLIILLLFLYFFCYMIKEWFQNLFKWLITWVSSKILQWFEEKVKSNNIPPDHESEQERDAGNNQQKTGWDSFWEYYRNSNTEEQYQQAYSDFLRSQQQYRASNNKSSYNQERTNTDTQSTYINPAFTILGISPTKDIKIIKQAYRQQIKKHHPDHGGDAAYFMKIQEAYNELIKEV